MICYDDDYNITNKKLLDYLLPLCQQGGNRFIGDCQTLRILFDLRANTDLCKNYDIETRDS